MKRLLSIELQKIRLNKASRILSLAYFILISFIAFIAFVNLNLGDVKFQVAEMGIFNFPYIWHFNTYIAAILKLFFAIVIVSMMANEYSYGTLKQNLIDGMTKKEFILSKFVAILFFSFCSTVFVFIMTLILGYNFSSHIELGIVFSGLEYVLAFFVKLVGFFTFCLFLAIVVKRSAFALGFLFVWNIIEGIVKGILAFKIFPDSNYTSYFTQLLPLESISNLIIEPFSRLSVIKTIGTQMGVENLKDYGVSFSAIAIVICWTFIFLFLSYKILKNRDL